MNLHLLGSKSDGERVYTCFAETQQKINVFVSSFYFQSFAGYAFCYAAGHEGQAEHCDLRTRESWCGTCGIVEARWLRHRGRNQSAGGHIVETRERLSARGRYSRGDPSQGFKSEDHLAYRAGR